MGLFSLQGKKPCSENPAKIINLTVTLIYFHYNFTNSKKRQNMENESLKEFKEEQKEKLKERVKSKILEQENADFLIRLLEKAESKTEVLKISALGMTYKRTGFHFDVRLEKMGQTIKYLEKNEKLSFYQGGLKHKLIIGDNYPALLNLLISYKKKVKVIYIDPPYGKDDLGEFAKTNYDNAITRDNLLSMLYPRLSLAKQLLRDDGVIFCSIDDRNQAYVKGLFDEVFGEGNFVCNFVWIKNATKNLSKTASTNHEYILCYAKDKRSVEQNDGFRLKKPGFDAVKALLEKATQEKQSKEETEKLLKDFYKANKHLKGITSYSSVEFKDGRYQVYTISDISAPKSTGKAATYEILHPVTKKPCKTPATGWRFTRETMDKMIEEGLIEFYENETNVPRVKRFLDSVETEVIKSYMEDFTDGKKELNSIFIESPFDNPKPTTLLKTLLALSTTPEVEESEIILDFFAGSGTTAHAVMQLNREDGGKRQCILVTNNEKTELNPNGIAFDVTSKRLKRIMSGECYDGTKNFQWLEKNAPYGDSLEVSEIVSLASSDYSVFEKIDEKLYEKDFKGNTAEKIEWICKEFELTCKKIEGEE